MVEGGMPPPKGVTPNFDNPDKTVWTASVVTQVLCISIVGAIVGLRVYVRIYIIRRFQLEDWMIVAGFLLAVGYSIIALTMNHYGGGINMWEVPKENLTPFGITVYATMMIYGPCAFCIKASILLIIARIFGPIKRAVLLVYIILGTLFAYYLPVLFLKAVICRPIEKFWNPTAAGQCFDQRALILADAVISVVSDMVIFAVPLPLTLNLRVKRRKRVKIAIVFGAGGLACIFTIIRLVDIVKNGTSPNQTLVFMRVNLWGVAEVYIGLITACIPFLPAFWKHRFGANDSTGYTRYSEVAHGAVRMRSIRSDKRSATVTTPIKQDCGSEENMLIIDPLASPAGAPKPTSYEQNSQQDMFRYAETFPATPPPALGAEAVRITKTVEIEQTYTRENDEGLGSRVDRKVF